ncbi:MAG: hypothetical protein ABEH65_04380 [Halobacteriales archaeon]
MSVSLDFFGIGVLWAVVLIIVGAPTIQAYQNGGLLVSITLGLAVPLAFYLVFTAFNLAYPSEDLLWGIGAALQFGVPAGTIGFLLGMGLRQGRAWLSR